MATANAIHKVTTSILIDHTLNRTRALRSDRNLRDTWNYHIRSIIILLTWPEGQKKILN